MAEKKSKIVFHPDRPIQTEKDDRLGFGVIADNLATSILNAGVNEGFVIGIEGAWGCGKSSILNLLCTRLEQEGHISIVKFAPWIVGHRDNMVSSMIDSLSTAIEGIEKKNGASKKALHESAALAQKLRKYGAQAGRIASPLAKLAALIPGLQGADKIAEALAGLDSSPSKPLANLKDELTTSLRKLKQTFVVVVDDLDRLEPGETTEIMRLIRAVGDFPNVIYVLCYDKSILTQSLEAALSIKDGSSFLQKIVQASFAVPKPEEFDLRRWLNEECQKLYELVTGTILPKDSADRLGAVCDTQGAQISTPREINLVLNSLRMSFPPIANKVDYPDLCWLHILKTQNEGFYRWIEEYLNTYAVVFCGEGMLNSRGRKKMAKDLLEHLQITDDDGEGDYMSGKSLWTLKEYIPGIVPGLHGKKSEELILNTDKMTGEHLAMLERDFRLASPSHYRLYFAFAQPSGVLHETTLSNILHLARSGTAPIKEFEELLDIKRAQGGTMYEILLDRLQRYDGDKLDAATAGAIVSALIATIDDGLRREREPGFFGVKGVARAGRAILQQALSVMSSKERSQFLDDIFTNGKSVGWLLTDVIGDELFSHGRVGEKENPDNKLLSAGELDNAIAIVHKRLGGSESSKIQNIPNPLSFFYRWRQSGSAGAKQLHDWMAKFSKSNAGFLKMMDMCRGYVISSDKGVYRPLQKHDLKSLFGGHEEIEKRLEKIAKGSNDNAQVKKAQELLEALSQGKRF